ncbi:spore wall protein 2-like isoform X1 [Lates japonicus]|uniref:Spore wall protein 2-like isoform X1 n=1 Tax=Lates japonicus TaxID=270547 RepID=A0AAD3QY28_LATJO|nr:spore wall protein 2-like isoform X1 [Lates japonicus]GLD68132.1 spore wall protein 2-like isoform X1 [Lates japonicus]
MEDGQTVTDPEEEKIETHRDKESGAEPGMSPDSRDAEDHMTPTNNTNLNSPKDEEQTDQSSKEGVCGLSGSSSQLGVGPEEKPDDCDAEILLRENTRAPLTSECTNTSAYTRAHEHSVNQLSLSSEPCLQRLVLVSQIHLGVFRSSRSARLSSWLLFRTCDQSQSLITFTDQSYTRTKR